MSREQHDREIEERNEKAEIRHICARKDVVLKQEKNKLINDLALLEHVDRATKCESLQVCAIMIFVKIKRLWYDVVMDEMFS